MKSAKIDKPEDEKDGEWERQKKMRAIFLPEYLNEAAP